MPSPDCKITLSRRAANSNGAGSRPSLRAGSACTTCTNEGCYEFGEVTLALADAVEADDTGEADGTPTTVPDPHKVDQRALAAGDAAGRARYLTEG